MVLSNLLKTIVKSKSIETKQSATRSMMAYHQPGSPIWSGRDYVALTKNGFSRNVIAYRCIRMIAEAASSAPLRIMAGGSVMHEHPIITLLEAPNSAQSGAEFFESVYGYLQASGNSYLEAGIIDGQVRELYTLRPDRVKVRANRTGWVEAYEYSVGGKKTVFPVPQNGGPFDKTISPILHVKLFHPLDDHYGMSPLEAAGANVDMHNAALSWNKALLDNAARPSGALVYSGPEGAENLTADQFDRLKSELDSSFGGARNAGKPLLLDGGLDWRSMSLSPADMDFIEAKHSAAREIALAFGVPPMLLGIPGDNTYSNYREANLAFWKQTVLPLVKKVAASLSMWLRPGIESNQDFSIICDISDIDALSTERDALWRRISSATFLTDDEKREQLGLPLSQNSIGENV